MGSENAGNNTNTGKKERNNSAEKENIERQLFNKYKIPQRSIFARRGTA
jgi:hypothetical protein